MIRKTFRLVFSMLTYTHACRSLLLIFLGFFPFHTFAAAPTSLRPARSAHHTRAKLQDVNVAEANARLQHVYELLCKAPHGVPYKCELTRWNHKCAKNFGDFDLYKNHLLTVA